MYTNAQVMLRCDRQFVIKQSGKKKERAAVSEQYKSAFAVVISTELSITDYSRSDQKTGKSSLSYSFLYPARQKVAGYYVIPSENFEFLSVCPSVRPPVSASFLDSNLSSY